MDKQKNIKQAETDNICRLISSEELSLPKDGSSLVSLQSFSTWVRSLLQNWRQGTVGAKGRSDVARSNKKPWKQKGTGRARAGSARSPLWRGGGVIFGPCPRVAQKDVSKNTKRKVLVSMLSHNIDKGNVYCLDWQFNSEVPKTAHVVSLLKSAQLYNKKITMFIASDDQVMAASCANIPLVQVVPFDQLNAYTIALGNHWVVFERDLNLFKEMVSRWV